MRPGGRIYTVFKRAALGVYSDGFIHAGNIAYLALLTMFPFFIVMAALAQLFGRTPDVQQAVHGFLVTVPRSVRDLIGQPINDVLAANNKGALLLAGCDRRALDRGQLRRDDPRHPPPRLWHEGVGQFLALSRRIDPDHRRFGDSRYVCIQRTGRADRRRAVHLAAVAGGPRISADHQSVAPAAAADADRRALRDVRDADPRPNIGCQHARNGRAPCLRGSGGWP